MFYYLSDHCWGVNWNQLCFYQNTENDAFGIAVGKWAHRFTARFIKYFEYLSHLVSCKKIGFYDLQATEIISLVWHGDQLSWFFSISFLHVILQFKVLLPLLNSQHALKTDANLRVWLALGLAKTIPKEPFQIRIEVLQGCCSRHQMIIFIIAFK